MINSARGAKSAGADDEGSDTAGEALILSLALQLERLRPWPRVAPGFASEPAESELQA
jgi:hypothetical protein